MFGLIGGIVGGALGLIGAKSTNKSNERQTKETNAQNLAFSEKQNAEQLELAKQAVYLNSPEGIRAEAEKAGFNPNVFTGSAGSFGAGYAPALSHPNFQAPQMGNEYAQLGQGIADAFNGYEQLKIQRSELDMQQQRLEHLQKAVTLGEDVPGIYGARNANGSNRSRGGVSGAGNNAPYGISGARGGGVSEPEDAYQAGGFGTLTGPGGTDVMTNPGLPKSVEDYYGDDTGDFLGAMNFIKDTWHGTIKKEVFYPGWGWESDILRPKLPKNRPADKKRKTPKKPKPPKKDAPYMPPLDKKTARRKVMRSSSENWGDRFLQSFYP